jgi:prepilin-type processing-associated H-X9-DG protein
MNTKQGTTTEGFTRTELLVLVGVVAVFSVALAADLTQTRGKLLQQACAANMKQWGLAFDLYSQDYNGVFYYDVGGLHFDDSAGSPVERYLGNVDPRYGLMRSMRICPAVAARHLDPAFVHSYSMPIGTYRKGIVYANADQPASPYYGNVDAPYWPNLKSCPNPSKFLLLIDSNGHTLHCGGLLSAVWTVPVGTDADQVPAIYRHGGSVNCLFGDFHVELVTAETITNQNAITCNSPSGNPWFTLD